MARLGAERGEVGCRACLSMCGLSECEVRAKIVSGVVYLSVTLCRVRMSGLQPVWQYGLSVCVRV